MEVCPVLLSSCPDCPVSLQTCSRVGVFTLVLHHHLYHPLYWSFSFSELFGCRSAVIVLTDSPSHCVLSPPLFSLVQKGLRGAVWRDHHKRPQARFLLPGAATETFQDLGWASNQSPTAAGPIHGKFWFSSSLPWSFTVRIISRGIIAGKKRGLL